MSLNMGLIQPERLTQCGVGSRNIRMFLEPGVENINQNNLVAPTGFEPVFQP